MTTPDKATMAEQIEPLSKVELTYLALLLLPHNALRLRLQPELAACRDAIALATDQSAEDIQIYFEATACDVLAFMSRPSPAAEVTGLETIQTLLDLLNPLHGSLDKQTYDEKVRAGFDAPSDAEYAVNVTAQQERDLTQAVMILEDRKRQTSTVAAAEVTGERALREALALLFPEPERRDGLTVDHSADENLEAAIIDIEGGRAAKVVIGTLNAVLTLLVAARSKYESATPSPDAGRVPDAEKTS